MKIQELLATKKIRRKRDFTILFASMRAVSVRNVTNEIIAIQIFISYKSATIVQNKIQ